jgi:hypothetical protein
VRIKASGRASWGHRNGDTGFWSPSRTHRISDSWTPARKKKNIKHKVNDNDKVRAVFVDIYFSIANFVADLFWLFNP